MGYATVAVSEVELTDVSQSVSVERVPLDENGEPVDGTHNDWAVEVFGDGAIHLWSQATGVVETSFKAILAFLGREDEAAA